MFRPIRSWCVCVGRFEHVYIFIYIYMVQLSVGIIQGVGVGNDVHTLRRQDTSSRTGRTSILCRHRLSKIRKKAVDGAGLHGGALSTRMRRLRMATPLSERQNDLFLLRGDSFRPLAAVGVVPYKRRRLRGFITDCGTHATPAVCTDPPDERKGSNRFQEAC